MSNDFSSDGVRELVSPDHVEVAVSSNVSNQYGVVLKGGEWGGRGGRGGEGREERRGRGGEEEGKEGRGGEEGGEGGIGMGEGRGREGGGRNGKGAEERWRGGEKDMCTNVITIYKSVTSLQNRQCGVPVNI